MVTVYTALFGDRHRDHLWPPPRDPDARYVCVTDMPIHVSGWQILHHDACGRSPVLMARLVKMDPRFWIGLSGPQTTVWVDASCQLLKPVSAYVGNAAPILAFRHPDRASLEDEAKVIVKWRLAPGRDVLLQLKTYHDNGFETKTTALTTTGLLVRTHAAEAFNRLWEEQIRSFTLRDQLSIDYCAWKTKTRIAYLPGHYRENPIMRYHPHARIAA